MTQGWQARTAVGLAGLLMAGAAAAAGRVEVRMIEPQQFADAGWGTIERERNLAELTRHMEGWAPRLPDGTALTLEVLDVDLAGEPWRSVRRPELRIMDGRLDGPRLTLRWTYRRDAQVLRSGQERLSDMNYLMGGFGPHVQETLGYDKRMFDRWMRTRVLAGEAAP